MDWVSELEKSLFGNHYSKNWFGQESSIDAKYR